MFSEHRGRTGNVPGTDAAPPDTLCKKERQESEKSPQNLGARDLSSASAYSYSSLTNKTKQSTGAGAGAGDTAQWQSPGLAHRGPDFPSQAHKEVKKPRNSEYHLDSSKVHEKSWKLELEAHFLLWKSSTVCAGNMEPKSCV